MSNDNFTPETLHIGYLDVGRGVVRPTLYYGQNPMAECFHDSVAKRIAAAYNAVKGIPTEALERGIIVGMVKELRTEADRWVQIGADPKRNDALARADCLYKLLENVKIS